MKTILCMYKLYICVKVAKNGEISVMIVIHTAISVHEYLAYYKGSNEGTS